MPSFENCFVFQNKQVEMIPTQYKNTKLGLLVLKQEHLTPHRMHPY